MYLVYFWGNFESYLIFNNQILTNMKKALLFTILLASFISFEAMSQCGRVGLIGEFNGWAGDHFMTRNYENPALFSTFITLTAEDDTSDPPDGIISLKFRANSDWGVNWGAADFPSGTGVQDGDNIPVPPGNYYVTFNCETGAYNFQTTCGTIGLIGEFNGWAGDYSMYRDPVNIDLWTTTITLTSEDDTSDPPDGIIGLKFRENAGWTINWGAADFPSGTGVQDGDNIPVPPGKYKITFNCATGEYNFTTTCGEIGIIGEFNAWAGDVWMTRSESNPDEWHAILSLNDAQDVDPVDGFIKVKFRENADWAVNWGSTDFPSGIGTQNGPDLLVPLDDQGITTDYFVTFNCATGAYNFAATKGSISITGAFINWLQDIPMNRDASNPDLWTLSRSWYADSEIKFRENNDWTLSWGNSAWPSGIAIENASINIPLVAGKYDVTFNTSTLAYNFVANNEICGEIGLIGDFNDWGAGDPATDLWMVRDAEYPSQFTATVNFTSATGLLFRLDGDQTYTYVWGGTSLCQTGVMDPSKIIAVSGGKYNITFNCKSGDYCFERLGNSVIAPKVFAMTMDGVLNEADWKINQNISRIVDGTASADLNTVNFGVTYNDEFLFVGIDITDAIPSTGDGGEVFLDGNKSGGAYDASDIHLKFGIGGIEVIYGPAGIECQLGFGLTTTGYAGEVAIPWAALGLTPGAVMGFDIIVSDDDTGTGVADYKLAWNGGLQDYENTSSFGDLVFGVLSCGCVSVYNETIGDVILRNPIDETTKYVGTYNFDANYNLVFRKDLQGTVTWAKDIFPEGTAVLGGAAIPATSGRYRITFDCITGEYKFVVSSLPAEGIAYADYVTTAPVIDGDLGEYNLQYGSEIIAAGTGPNNNTVTWGAVWDQNSLYLGVKVVDAVVEGIGNPWDNDAIEYYIDGNNDKGSKVEAGFDTQLIQDFFSNSTVDTALWFKADGVQATPDQWDAKWKATSDGYNVEVRLAWSIFDFAPGKGRVMGFSLGNNDSDNGIGRDYQTVWYGTGSNWSNPADLGDLQLAGGPYFYGFEEIFFNASINLYPNPTNGNVYLQTTTNDLNGDITIYVSDITGKTLKVINERLNGINNIVTIGTDDLPTGMYIVNIITESGKRAVKKLIVY